MALCSRYQHLYDKYLPREDLDSFISPKNSTKSPKIHLESSKRSKNLQNPQLLELDRIRAQKRKRELEKLERRERNRERNEELLRSLGKSAPESQGKHTNDLTECLLKSFGKSCQNPDVSNTCDIASKPTAKCRVKEAVDGSKTQGLFTLIHYSVWGLYIVGFKRDYIFINQPVEESNHAVNSTA